MSKFYVEDLNPERLQVKLKNFDIQIYETDEGIVVDVYGLPDKDGNQACIASTYAYDNECDPEEVER